MSERPTRVRSWAPKGQTPVLRYSFNWKQLSLIAGVSLWRLYFRFFHGTIKGPQIVEFLKALVATIGGKLLIIWDRLPAHRSRVVRTYIESLGDYLQLERLPAYAPELNPAEYVFGYAKQRELAQSVCGHDRGGARLCHPAPAIDAEAPETDPGLLAAGRTGDLNPSCIY